MVEGLNEKLVEDNEVTSVRCVKEELLIKGGISNCLTRSNHF